MIILNTVRLTLTKYHTTVLQVPINIPSILCVCVLFSIVSHFLCHICLSINAITYSLASLIKLSRTTTCTL